ncbi:MAG: response regulator, partial [Desulfobulbaceae bacterium]|nr:response regulator [Desulfobulbaceae bacterium]
MENSTRPGILSVDDNPFNRDLIRILVKRQGIPIQEAENGIEALAKVEKFEFELIFMDLLMPGMDGFETIKRIRGMGIKTPIVAVSAISFKQDRRRAMESGCDHFLPKPINKPEFLKIIKKYVPDEKPDENEPAPVADPNKESRKVTALSGMNFSDFHLLLVEENDILSKRYEKMLMEIGFQVQPIRSGNEAWERLQDSESHV